MGAVRQITVMGTQVPTRSKSLSHKSSVVLSLQDDRVTKDSSESVNILENISKIQTLPRKLSLCLRKRSTDDSTVNCSQDFKFIQMNSNHRPRREAGIERITEEEDPEKGKTDSSIGTNEINQLETVVGVRFDLGTVNQCPRTVPESPAFSSCSDKSSHPRTSTMVSLSPPRGPHKLKGVLWEQTDRLFSRWQEKFFVLTELSLHSFQRQASTWDSIGRAVSTTMLSDVGAVELTNKKGQLVLVLITRDKKATLLRQAEGIKEWAEKVRENVSWLRSRERGRRVPLMSSISCLASSSSSRGRPCMGVSGLGRRWQK